MSAPKRPDGPPSKHLRVAAVQMAFSKTIPANLAAIERLATRASSLGADAVLFPECATTGYACDFGELDPIELRQALRAVASIADRLRINLLVGSPIFGGHDLYNSLVVFDRRGEMVHAYAKCQLTDADRKWFAPGNAVSLFAIDGIQATAIVCHERRYPELARLGVMAGARIVFHPNAGMDSLAVSRGKHGGRDGIAVRAFENAVPYVFANSVGPQGRGKWSAGDSKIVGADGTVLELADNQNESVVVADLDLSKATGKYALESLRHPRFLAPHWQRMLADARARARESDAMFRRWYNSDAAP